MTALLDSVDEDLQQVIVDAGTTYTFSTSVVETFSGVEPMTVGGNQPMDSDGRRRAHVTTLRLTATGVITDSTTFELSNGKLNPAATILVKQGMITAVQP